MDTKPEWCTATAFNPLHAIAAEMTHKRANRFDQASHVMVFSTRPGSASTVIALAQRQSVLG